MSGQSMRSIEISKHGNLLVSILLTGLIAGFLDGLAAVLDTWIRVGSGPAGVFKFIASGVYGKEAFSGGTTMIIAGIFFHLFIATSWAFLFFILFPRLKILQKNKYVVGIIYGILIWSFMNRVVLPLANTPKASSFNILQVLKAMTYIILFVGLPISLLANHYYRKGSMFLK